MLVKFLISHGTASNYFGGICKFEVLLLGWRPKFNLWYLILVWWRRIYIVCWYLRWQNCNSRISWSYATAWADRYEFFCNVQGFTILRTTNGLSSNNCNAFKVENKMRCNRKYILGGNIEIVCIGASVIESRMGTLSRDLELASWTR